MLKLHAFLHWVNILINTAWLTFNPLEIYENIVKDFLINKMQHSQPANIGPQDVP